MVIDFMADYNIKNCKELLNTDIYFENKGKDKVKDKSYFAREPKYKIDIDDSNISRAIYCVLWKDVFNGKCLSEARKETNGLNFRGDTLCTARSLLGKDEDKKLSNSYHRFSNFIVWPWNFNKHRGFTYSQYIGDFSDLSLKILQKAFNSKNSQKEKRDRLDKTTWDWFKKYFPRKKDTVDWKKFVDWKDFVDKMLLKDSFVDENYDVVDIFTHDFGRDKNLKPEDNIDDVIEDIKKIWCKRADVMAMKLEENLI
jgi:hypothetical protein